jgi:8-oxo-dGTP diphosphatase
VEAGESPREALVREIREELAAEIALEDHLGTVAYDYPDFHLEMDCYLARFVGPGMVLREHEAARWLTKEQLDSVEWLPADKVVVEQL